MITENLQNTLKICNRLQLQPISHSACAIGKAWKPLFDHFPLWKKWTFAPSQVCIVCCWGTLYVFHFIWWIMFSLTHAVVKGVHARLIICNYMYPFRVSLLSDKTIFQNSPWYPECNIQTHWNVFVTGDFFILFFIYFFYKHTHKLIFNTAVWKDSSCCRRYWNDTLIKCACCQSAEQ